MFEKIKNARLEKGMTQNELAATSGVSRSTIIGLEKGQITNTKTDTLRKLANALGITLDEIFFADSVRRSEQAKSNGEKESWM